MIKAYAKVNLGLTIKQLTAHSTKHQLESIFIKLEKLYDEIFISKSDKLSITYYVGTNKISFDNDIVYKVILYLKNKFNIDVADKIVINKKIPQQAGLGGSSSDGAYVMRYYLDKYNIKLSEKDYLDIALNLSSDIPFFLYDCNIALVSEYGNKVSIINKVPPKLKLIANNYKCSTKQMYEIFDARYNPYRQQNNFKAIIDNLSNLNNCIIINDLENCAFSIIPELKAFKKINTLMTGSGSYFIEWEVENENKN